MKAMILAAGMGIRLRPLTLIRPKALVPIANRPVIEIIIEYLKKQGVTEVVVNAHHLSHHMVEYLDGGKRFDMPIEVRVEPEILGTGGGIRNTSDFWGDEPFLVINSDIVTDLDLSGAINFHKKTGNIATLILHDHEPFNKIKIDENSTVVEISYGCQKGGLAFTGMHVISPGLLGYIPAGVYYDIIECYRRLIHSGVPIGAYLAHGFYWRDIGTLDDYVLANREALKGTPFLFSEDCMVDDGASIREWAVIGEHCLVEKGAEVARSILWDRVKIRKGVRIMDSVVTSSQDVTRDVVSGIVWDEKV